MPCLSGEQTNRHMGSGGDGFVGDLSTFGHVGERPIMQRGVTRGGFGEVVEPVVGEPGLDNLRDGVAEVP